MTLSPRVGGATSKPTDASPSPASQRFASNSCVTTKMTYEFFNELIENFTLAQAGYGVTNIPNDPNALKKILDRLRTGGYDFDAGNIRLTSGLSTNNTDVTIGTGKLIFNANDWISYNDTTNSFEFNADSSVTSSTIRAGVLNSTDANIDTINERTPNNGVLIEGVRIKDSELFFNVDDKINYNDTTNSFEFYADGNINNSRIMTGSINFGEDTLNQYFENITFTATFYTGTTQITGSSGMTNVASYDARVSKIGNIVTVNISNIVWSVTGDIRGNVGTTLGTYPAITLAGESSIRGLPYNALKDSCGSVIGFYNNSGNSNTGSAYIIAGTNSIRFSDMGFGGGFGIRGVTITYMV